MDGGETPDTQTRTPLAPGTKVDVRNRFQGTWVRGFEIAEVTDDGIPHPPHVGRERPGRAVLT